MTSFIVAFFLHTMQEEITTDFGTHRAFDQLHEWKDSLKVRYLAIKLVPKPENQNTPTQ